MLYLGDLVVSMAESLSTVTCPFCCAMETVMNQCSLFSTTLYCSSLGNRLPGYYKRIKL